MWLMQIGLSLLILILIYNAFYSFLPSSAQAVLWVRVVAIICALVILVWGIRQVILDYRNYRFAYVSAKDGRILKKKNFPWSITKTTTRDGNIVYIINERYGDASEVSVKLIDKPGTSFTIYNAMDGVGVKFRCPDHEIPDFKIIIK